MKLLHFCYVSLIKLWSGSVSYFSLQYVVLVPQYGVSRLKSSHILPKLVFVTVESCTLGTISKDAYLNQDIKTHPNTDWGRVAEMVFEVLFILPFGGM